MVHIPPHKILPQDKVDVVDLGPRDPGEPKFEPGTDGHAVWERLKAEFEKFVADGSKPQIMRMHVSDARHAMDVEPERFVLTPDPAPDAPDAPDEEDFDE